MCSSGICRCGDFPILAAIVILCILGVWLGLGEQNVTPFVERIKWRKKTSFADHHNSLGSGKSKDGQITEETGSGSA